MKPIAKALPQRLNAFSVALLRAVNAWDATQDQRYDNEQRWQAYLAYRNAYSVWATAAELTR